MSDKQEQIFEEIKRRAQEIRFGTMTIKLKIHQEKITAGEIIGERKLLG